MTTIVKIQLKPFIGFRFNIRLILCATSHHQHIVATKPLYRTNIWCQGSREMVYAALHLTHCSL